MFSTMMRFIVVVAFFLFPVLKCNGRMCDFGEKKRFSDNFLLIPEQTCVTPDRYNGQCVDVKNCKNLYGILINAPRPLPDRVRDFLQRAKCVNHPNPVCTQNSFPYHKFKVDLLLF